MSHWRQVGATHGLSSTRPGALLAPPEGSGSYPATTLELPCEEPSTSLPCVFIGCQGRSQFPEESLPSGPFPTSHSRPNTLTWAPLHSVAAGGDGHWGCPVPAAGSQGTGAGEWRWCHHLPGHEGAVLARQGHQGWLQSLCSCGCQRWWTLNSGFPILKRENPKLGEVKWPRLELGHSAPGCMLRPKCCPFYVCEWEIQIPAFLLKNPK